MDDLGKVVRPWHYQNNGLETIDVIEAHVDGTEYCMGAAIKYVCRWKSKNKEKDLLKALWYIARVLSYSDQGNQAVETVQAAVRRKSAEQPSNDTPTDKPARGIRFSDG